MIYILLIDPYTPYEVNISAVTIAGIGEPLHKIFFIQERGKTKGTTIYDIFILKLILTINKWFDFL